MKAFTVAAFIVMFIVIVVCNTALCIWLTKEYGFDLSLLILNSIILWQLIRVINKVLAD